MNYTQLHCVPSWQGPPFLTHFPCPGLSINPSDAEATFVHRHRYFWKTFKPCHVGIHRIALAEYSQMRTHLPGFQSFVSFFLHHFILAKLAISSIRVSPFPALWIILSFTVWQDQPFLSHFPRVGLSINPYSKQILENPTECSPEHLGNPRMKIPGCTMLHLVKFIVLLKITKSQNTWRKVVFRIKNPLLSI